MCGDVLYWKFRPGAPARRPLAQLNCMQLIGVKKQPSIPTWLTFLAVQKALGRIAWRPT